MKLNQLLELISLPLTGRADERSSSGEVKPLSKVRQAIIVTNNPSVSLRSTAPFTKGSQGYVSYSSHSRGGGSLASRVVLSLVGFLSTLLISLFNATPTSASSITLNISAATNACPNTAVANKDADICFQIPKGGGIATSNHTIKVTTDASMGYSVSFAAAGSNNMVSKGSSNVIKSVIHNAPTNTDNGWVTLGNNEYGIAIPGQDYSQNNPESDYISTNPDMLANARFAGVPANTNGGAGGILNKDQPTPSDGTSVKVYYGARVDNPSEFKSGDYSVDIVYTATAKLPPAPTVKKLILNDTILTGQEKELAIEGTGMDNVTDIIICPKGETPNTNTTSSTNCLTVPATNYKANNNNTIASFTSPKIANPGIYHVYASTGNVSDTYATLIVQEQTVCKSGDSSSNCTVNLDDNMVPIKYDEDIKQWVATTADDPEWYDYSKKQWANAVTVNIDPYYNITNLRKPITSVDGTSPIRCYKMSILGGNNTFTITTTSCGSASMYSPASVYQMMIDNPGKYTIKYTDDDGQEVTSNKFIIFPETILSYWVYIPRYAYEVQRRDATDKFVMDEYELPDGSKLENDFTIKFEKSSGTKKVPTSGCSTVNGSTLTAKDYRTECGLSREYGSATGTTWATHPAFSWQSQDLTINKELNGIWVGKFETSMGTIKSGEGMDYKVQVIRPNRKHMANMYIGDYYDCAKNLGMSDPDNIYGNGSSTCGKQFNQTITATTHMLKNSEWGAVAYLSSSYYGAGVNNVYNNGNNQSGTDMNGQTSVGVTGCGPSGDVKSPGTDTYNNGTALNQSKQEDPQACSITEDRSYNSAIGQLASTTNNVYGIYDMAGGAYEYVMGNYSVSGDVSSSTTVPGFTNAFKNATKPPYVDLYPASIFTNNNTYTSNNQCTWSACGGHALHETKLVQDVSGDSETWGKSDSMFVSSEFYWFPRGGSNSAGAGIFSVGRSNGIIHTDHGFRVSLIAQ